jgi:serine/threonine-protein kinase
VEVSTYRPGQDVPGTVYRVLRHLATGGMGTVYEVEDTTVEKRYVLKTLHPQLLAREDLAQRMKDEAKVLAKLHHPHIVDVVTAGVTQDAARVPYYVMERLNGQNLRWMLEKKGALDLVYALRIAIDVLDALEHAHEHGVVHRDVKPENIFLHRNASGTTTTKLLDFGIMRLVDQKKSSSSLTRGKFVGTLRYASPEQILGEPLDGSSDLYALGLVLYEMICGRGPFDDVSEPFAVGGAHVNRPPPPLSRFVAVPPEVERLVLASLAKKPEDRPRDAFAFSEGLRRLMPDGPGSPRAPRVVTPAPATVTAGEGARPSGAREPPPPAGGGSVLLPIVAATLFAAVVLGGAALYVVQPWARTPAAAPVPPAGSSSGPSAGPSASGAPDKKAPNNTTPETTVEPLEKPAR